MASRLTRALAALSTTIVAAAVPFAASAVTAPTTDPLTAFTIDGHPQGVIEGQSEVKGAAVTVYAEANYVVLQGTDAAGRSASVGIGAPTGQTLEVGTYDAARFADATHGLLGAVNGSIGCNEIIGSFTVYEIARDESGIIDTLAASYVVSCDGAEPFVGQMRLNSSIDYLRFGDLGLGTSRPLTVTVTAVETTTFGTASVAGPESKFFQVTSDGCKGRTLAASATCPVTVTGWASVERPLRAELSVPVAGGAPRVVPMTVLGHETPLGGFTSLASPARLLDTRSATGVTTRVPLAAGRTITVQATGRGGVAVAAGVSAVVANLTTVAPGASGYLTAYPTGTTRPTASNLNFAKGVTQANGVTLPVSPSGQVTIYNGSAAGTHVLLDVTGYYRTGAASSIPYGAFIPTPAQRLADTRRPEWGGPLQSGWYLPIGVDYGAELNPHIKALAVNVTAVTPTGNGFLSAWNGQESALPKTSTVNYTRGHTLANLAVIPVSQLDFEGQTFPGIGVLNTGSTTHVIVDIVGLYEDNQVGGLRFRPLSSPKRIMDTRSGLGTGKLGTAARSVTAPTTVRNWNTGLLVSNATIVRPSTNTYATMWAAGSTKPGISNLNAWTGSTIPNMAYVPLNASYTYTVQNAGGTTDFIVDAAGGLENYPQLPPGVDVGTIPSPPAATTGTGTGRNATPLTAHRTLVGAARPAAG